jgi:hypothetical protein
MTDKSKFIDEKDHTIKLDEMTVFFDGRKKNVIISNKDFPTKKDFVMDLVKKKNPKLHVIIANWNVIVLREISLKILMRVIRVLFLFEKFFRGFKLIFTSISPIKIKITKGVTPVKSQENL